jgi:hypothetical protein
VDADALSTIGSVGSGLAALAALAAVLFARETVSETREGRREARDAHAKQLHEQRQLLEASSRAHEAEMAERARAFASELVLQRLAQRGRIHELVGEVADIARIEIGSQPPPTGVGIGRWTRVNGALVRLEAAVVIWERLGGPPLPDARQMSRSLRQMGTPPERVVGDAMGELAKLTADAETDESLNLPAGDLETRSS